MILTKWTKIIFGSVLISAVIGISATVCVAQPRPSYEYQHDNGLLSRTDEDGVQLFRKNEAQEVMIWSLPSSAISLQDHVDCEDICPPRYISFLALDESHGWVYFWVPLDQASNVPIYIYRAALKGGKPVRLAKTFASGLDNGVLSPDGRYLAYTEGWHGSGCHSGENAEVLDLQKGQVIDGPTASERASAEKQGNLISARHFTWSSNTSLKIENEIYPDCRKGPHTETYETFDVTTGPRRRD